MKMKQKKKLMMNRMMITILDSEDDLLAAVVRLRKYLQIQEKNLHFKMIKALTNMV